MQYIEVGDQIQRSNGTPVATFVDGVPAHERDAIVSGASRIQHALQNQMAETTRLRNKLQQEHEAHERKCADYQEKLEALELQLEDAQFQIENSKSSAGT